MTTRVSLGDGTIYELPCSYSTFVRRWRRALRGHAFLYLRFTPLTYANPHQIVCAAEVR